MASAMVPEVKVIADDDEFEDGQNGTKKGVGCGLDMGFDPQVLEAPKNPRMLAPPPRFSHDEDDEEAWIDFESYLEYPELLCSYSSLRPRLSYRKAINSEVEIQCGNGEKRVLRATCDWAEGAVNGDHLWGQTSASGDFCYVGDDYCCKSGTRMKCSACKIICHMGCIAPLVEKVKFMCKPTFRDVGPRQYREHTETHHHWVHRRNQKGKCKTCGKGFQSKLLFGSKEIVAISCSWCKSAFHNKETCFDIAKIGETCNLGIHQSIIVPPAWIVKLPRRGSFKSSLRKSPKKRSSTP